MHMAIQNRDPPDPPFRLHRQRSNRTVVENATTFAMISERVKCSGSEIRADSFFQDGATVVKSGPRRRPQTFRQVWRPGNPYFSRLGGPELAANHAVQATWIMSHKISVSVAARAWRKASPAVKPRLHRTLTRK
jgi:hypothetical protein